MAGELFELLVIYNPSGGLQMDPRDWDELKIISQLPCSSPDLCRASGGAGRQVRAAPVGTRSQESGKDPDQGQIWI